MNHLQLRLFKKAKIVARPTIKIIESYCILDLKNQKYK